MIYDFDTVTDRRHTSSLKYDFAKARGKEEDVLPLWVADMDFQVAQPVRERLTQAVAHGIYGYSESAGEYFQAAAGWYARHFNWKLEQDWLIKTPGVVFALAMAVKAYTEPGDSVIIQMPVYYPFREVIEDNGRVVVNNSLKNVNGQYEIDFEDFEQKIRENQVKLFLLCSPHNPVGRVWKEWELRKLADICRNYGVVIVSDEIHSDFVYGENHHTVLANLAPEYAGMTVTCTAPTKTFNLAGLQISNIWISNPTLRAKFKKQVDGAGYSQVGLMGLVGCQAAYEEGEEWLSQLLTYLQGNLDFLRSYLKENLPEITMTEPEGTYLIWLDFRALNLTEAQREELIVKKAKLWLDSGAMFGPDGEGFERINIACPRSTLKQALDQLKAAMRGEESF
jgi:cystathionine beta-lyase